MMNASSSNAPPSDTTLPTVPQKTHHYNTTDEGMFLAQQAADAKAAVRRTMADIKATAPEVANVRWWTQHYPWYAVGTAAVLGFLTATQVLAPANQQAQNAPPSEGPPVARPSWMASLFELLRSTLLSVVVEALHSNSQQSGRAQTQADGSLD